TTIVLLARSTPNGPNNTHSGQIAAPQATDIPSTAASTPSPLTTTATPLSTAAAAPTSQTASGLPCIVDISTWTGGSPDWVVHNGILYNDGSSGSNNGPTIIAPCQPGTTNYAVQAKIQVTNQSGGCFGLVLRGS